jgi:hypothetical protein
MQSSSTLAYRNPALVVTVTPDFLHQISIGLIPPLHFNK